MIFIEYVEFEIKRALEWLGGNDNKKLAAVLILRELAIHTPTLFYMQFQQFFDNIFSAVRDPKVFSFCPINYAIDFHGSFLFL